MSQTLKKVLIILSIVVLAALTVWVAYLVKNDYSYNHFLKLSPNYLSDLSQAESDVSEIAQSVKETCSENNVGILDSIANSVKNIMVKGNTGLYKRAFSYLDEVVSQIQCCDLYICDQNGTILYASTNDTQIQKLSDIGLPNPDEGQEIYALDDGSGNCRYYYYYRQLLDNGEYVYYIATFPTFNDMKVFESVGSLSSYISLVSPTSEYEVAAVNLNTGRMEFTSSGLKSWQGKDLQELGLSDSESLVSLSEDEAHKLSIGGHEQTIFGKRIQSSNGTDYYVMTVYSSNHLGNTVSILLLILAAYGLLNLFFGLGNASQGIGKKNLLLKMVALTIVVTLAAGLIGWCVVSSGSTTKAISQTNTIASAFNSTYDQHEQDMAEIRTTTETVRASWLNSLALSCESLQGTISNPTDERDTHKLYVTGSNGERIYLQDSFGNDRYAVTYATVLKKMVEANNLVSISIYGEDGKVIATSDGNWNADLYSSTYTGYDEWVQVLEREENYIHTREEDDSQKVGVFVFPVNLYLSLDAQNNTVFVNLEDERDDSVREDGIVVIKVDECPDYTEDFNTILFSSIDSLCKNQTALLSQTDEGTLQVNCSNSINDMILVQMDLLEAPSTGALMQLCNILGENVFAVLRQSDMQNIYVLSAYATGSLDEDGLACVLTYSAFLFVLMAAFAIWLVWKEPKEAKRKNITLGDIREAAQKSSRITKEVPKNSGLWKYYATYVVVSLIFAAAILVILHNVEIVEQGLLCNATIWYVVHQQFNFGFNYYSLCYALLMIGSFAVFLYLVRKLLNCIMGITTSYTASIISMAYSVFACLAGAVLLIHILSVFGLDTTLLASTSIAAIAISVLASGVANDMTAGVHLILEKTIQLGDNVTINGFNGTITHISMRSTRIMDSTGNVKTFPNSRLDGIINHSFNYIIVSIKLNADASFPVKNLKALVDNQLTEALKDNPFIIDKPFLNAVTLSSETTYSAEVCAYCDQENSRLVLNMLYYSLISAAKQAENGKSLQIKAPSQQSGGSSAQMPTGTTGASGGQASGGSNSTGTKSGSHPKVGKLASTQLQQGSGKSGSSSQRSGDGKSQPTASQQSSGKPGAAQPQQSSSKPSATQSQQSSSKPSATQFQQSSSKPSATQFQQSSSKPSAAQPQQNGVKAGSSQPQKAGAKASSNKPAQASAKASPKGTQEPVLSPSNPPTKTDAPKALTDAVNPENPLV